MPSNAFLPEELVNLKGKAYPVVGGRLRLAHESGDVQGINTEIVEFKPREVAVVKAIVLMSEGGFTGYGYADSKRDGRLSDALLELAETRAIARALRFSGYGVEFTSAEEMSHVKDTEDKPKWTPPAKGQASFTTGDKVAPGVDRPATEKQLAFLAKLAEQNNQRPPAVKTAKEASEAIEVLKTVLGMD